MGHSAYVAPCDMCGHRFSTGRLARSRYENLYGDGPVLDQGVLCTRCWKDLPLIVWCNGHPWQLISRAY
jgi:hypothetical protein